jgi:hypothetical protein
MQKIHIYLFERETSKKEQYLLACIILALWCLVVTTA